MKRPGSANAQFVKRIPGDLRTQLVGRELVVPLGEDVAPAVVKINDATQSIRLSLRSSLPSEVKIRHAAAASYVEEVFASLRERRPITLSRAQAVALAGEAYRSSVKEPDPDKGIAHLHVGDRMVRVMELDGFEDVEQFDALANLVTKYENGASRKERPLCQSKT